MHFRPRGVRIRPQDEGPEAERPTAHTVLQAQNQPANKSKQQLPGPCSQWLPGWDVRLSRASQHDVLSCILTLSCISSWIFFSLCAVCSLCRGPLYLPWGAFCAQAFALETFSHFQPFSTQPLNQTWKPRKRRHALKVM